MPTEWEDKTYYYVLYYQGDTLVIECFEAEYLEKALEEKHFGERRIVRSLPKYNHRTFWGDILVIIKGSIVFPQAMEVVTKYKLP